MYRSTRLHRRLAGFTMVELVFAVAIILVLAALGLGGWKNAQARGQYQNCASNLRVMSQAMEAYKHENDFYPPSGTDLTSLDAATWRRYGLVEIPTCPSCEHAYVYGTSDNGLSYTLECCNTCHDDYADDGNNNSPVYSSETRKITPKDG